LLCWAEVSEVKEGEEHRSIGIVRGEGEPLAAY
jgi:hypothetical protein